MALKGLTLSSMVVLASLVVCGGPVRAERARLVLLDEYWSPEITHNGTVVEEVDTEKTGDPTEAVAGYFSARLENEVGAPNVRFRNAPAMRPGDLPEGTEVRLWYRTDNFNGNLRLAIWLYSPDAGRPVSILEADLDGGGGEGRLIADDRWHRASGVLRKGDEYDMVATDAHPRVSWVWLTTTEGWDISHRTYVDRIEVVAHGEASVPDTLPVRHVRRMPGAQESGPGLIWWEAEDALEEQEPARDNFAPSDASDQRLLSNGRWVLKAPKGNMDTMRYPVELKEAGTYSLWSRGYWPQGTFRWRWNGAEWRSSAPGLDTMAAVPLRGDWLLVGWAYLGEVDLPAGTGTFEVESVEAPAGHGFDCWVLKRGAFAPPSGPGRPSD